MRMTTARAGTFALFSILKRQAELGKRGEVQTWHFTAHIVVASVRQWSRLCHKRTKELRHSALGQHDNFSTA